MDTVSPLPSPTDLNQVTACHISEREASLCQAIGHYIESLYSLCNFILLQLLLVHVAPPTSSMTKEKLGLL